MRVILYSRVSTDEQASSGISLEAQEAKLRAYASLYDLEVVCLIQDAGASAKSLRRDGIQEALRLLKTGQADGIVVAKLDRLTRSVADFQALIDGYFCDKAGKQLFSVADSIDTRTAAGRMVLNIIVTIAQWERETISERTSEAMTHKRRKGERIGTIPYGWDADGANLVENATEQQSICLMRTLRSTGCSFARIASELTARGIRTKTGAGRWQHTAVRSILNRPVAKAVA